MMIIDLTHSMRRKAAESDAVPLVVRSSLTIEQVPLDRLVTLATVVDLMGRAEPGVVCLPDLARTGVADIGGCILCTGWCDAYLRGARVPPPELTIDAAAYLLEGGVHTVASDFPVTGGAADMLLHNNCVLVHCLSGVRALSRGVVRLVALPLKLEDAFSADARVVAMEG